MSAQAGYYSLSLDFPGHLASYGSGNNHVYGPIWPPYVSGNNHVYRPPGGLDFSGNIRADNFYHGNFGKSDTPSVFPIFWPYLGEILPAACILRTDNSARAHLYI